MTQVVESQQPIEEHEHAVRDFKVVFGVFADFFELPYHVIGEISNRARGERWKVGDVRGPVLVQEALHDLKDVSLLPLDGFSPPDGDLRTASLHLHVGADAEEGIASDFFTAL